ncbi:MAG: twin-arginine translocase TatA/TatE family subunit [Acidimicrobiales bacterium]
MLLGLLEGYDLLIVLGIIALLFGGSQLPKLARSLGSASHEFKKGVDEGHQESEKTSADEAKAKEAPGTQTS